MLNAIVDASLRYKVLVLVAFAVLVGLGVQAYRNVPVDAFPDVTPVQVNIYTESPGLAAEDVERLLTTPIEGAMAGMKPVVIGMIAAAALLLIFPKTDEGAMAQQIIIHLSMMPMDIQLKGN